ncbi:MAG TPA: hypothetical protein VN794_18665 [Methylomirabilota bacterium]|nr:hypothetical protein [Methylomirabilota bacterium]
MNSFNPNMPIHSALNALTTTALHLSKNGYHIRKVHIDRHKAFLHIDGPLLEHGRPVPCEPHGEHYERAKYMGSWVLWNKMSSLSEVI